MSEKCSLIIYVTSVCYLNIYQKKSGTVSCESTPDLEKVYISIRELLFILQHHPVVDCMHITI